MRSEILLVGISGFLGAIARYLVYLRIGVRAEGGFPWATLTVNLLGCLLIGVLAVLIGRDGNYARHLYLIGAVGFLGAFTTFSAFGLELFQLLREQQLWLAFWSVSANMVGGLLAVGLGFLIASVLIPAT